MTLRDFAERELTAAGYDPNDTDDSINKMMREAVLDLIDTFSDQGHSGFSAPYAIDLFSTLAKWEPLTPLTGADDEWTEVSDGLWQNKRCSHVFKGEDGRAYDIEGRIFSDPDGACFTSRDSRVYVDFPYTPTREYVDHEVPL
jgi:hypothetical protein